MSPYQRVNIIEKNMAENIGHKTFIPFVQLHEYETLLFADPAKMEEWLSLYNRIPKSCFQKIVDQCGGNPELINEDPSTAPSKRIITLCSAYDKVDDGVLILKEIGLDVLRAKCQHFNEWVAVLEALR